MPWATWCYSCVMLVMVDGWWWWWWCVVQKVDVSTWFTAKVTLWHSSSDLHWWRSLSTVRTPHPDTPSHTHTHRQTRYTHTHLCTVWRVDCYASACRVGTIYINDIYPIFSSTKIYQMSIVSLSRLSGAMFYRKYIAKTKKKYSLILPIAIFASFLVFMLCFLLTYSLVLLHILQYLLFNMIIILDLSVFVLLNLLLEWNMWRHYMLG